MTLHVGNKDCKFAIRTISISEAKLALRKLKPKMSSGPTQIPKKLIKNANEVLFVTFHRIFNTSVRLAKFPDEFRNVNAVPVHKRKSKQDKSNFRQIVSIDPVCACLEMVINSQYLDYLTQNNLLPSENYAFVPGDQVGTICCLKDAIAKWVKNRDRNEYTVIVSLDLSSAFPCLSPSILCSKMEALGITQDSLKWFKSYFDYRRVITKVGNAKSNVEITVGPISEGSEIRSTLFLVAICDIHHYLKHTASNSFADDQLQSVSSKKLEEALTKAQDDANTVVEYFKMNKFAINASKTAFMVIKPETKAKNKEKSTIIVDGHTIHEVESFKMLGYILDNKLKNDAHTDHILKKCRKMLGAIKRLSYKLSKEALTSILKASMIGRIMYAGMLYLHDPQIRKKIQTLVMKGARLILRQKKIDKMKNKDILEKLSILPLEQIYKRQALLEMIKWKPKWDSLFEKMFQNTRGNAKLQFRTMGKKQKTMDSFLNHMIKIWNDYGYQIIAESLIKQKSIIKSLIH